MSSYPWQVITIEAFLGNYVWGAQTKTHALALAKELREIHGMRIFKIEEVAK